MSQPRCKETHIRYFGSGTSHVIKDAIMLSWIKERQQTQIYGSSMAQSHLLVRKLVFQTCKMMPI